MDVRGDSSAHQYHEQTWDASQDVTQVLENGI